MGSELKLDDLNSIKKTGYSDIERIAVSKCKSFEEAYKVTTKNDKG